MGGTAHQTRKSTVQKSGECGMQRRIKRRRPQKKRYDFLRGMKKAAAFLYWFASFILIVLEIWNVHKELVIIELYYSFR